MRLSGQEEGSACLRADVFEFSTFVFRAVRGLVLTLLVFATFLESLPGPDRLAYEHFDEPIRAISPGPRRCAGRCARRDAIDGYGVASARAGSSSLRTSSRT